MTEHLAEDEELVLRAGDGDAAALSLLVERHQDWVYNVALRFVWDADEAADATQEIMIKAVTKIGTFRGGAKFSSWLYRVAVNHLLSMKRGRREERAVSFDQLGERMAAVPAAEPATDAEPEAERRLAYAETAASCLTGMLLCLDRQQRMAVILGAVLGLEGRLAAGLMDVSEANFRQHLSRGRRDLRQFMAGQCGLVDPLNQCRCSAKTAGFVRLGVVDPLRRQFTRRRIAEVAAMIPATQAEVERWVTTLRGTAWVASPNVAAAITERLRGLGDT